MTAAIEAAGLIKTYPPDVRALDGLDLTVAPGTIYALVGPNGAGKSTTVKILTTLAIADEGTAIVEGIDVRADPARTRRAITPHRCVGTRTLTGASGSPPLTSPTTPRSASYAAAPYPVHTTGIAAPRTPVNQRPAPSPSA